MTDASWDDDTEEMRTLHAISAQLTALLAMAPGRRYCADKLPTHLHGLTLEGQLDLHRQPDRPRARPALLSASTNKVLRWELFACWQDELALLHSLATSDGSWPDELVACPPSPPSDSSAAPSLVTSSDDDEDWVSPPTTALLCCGLAPWAGCLLEPAPACVRSPQTPLVCTDEQLVRFS